MISFSTSFKRLMIFSLGFVILLNMLHTVKAANNTTELIESNAANIDLLWMLMCAILVFMMQAGLCVLNTE